MASIPRMDRMASLPSARGSSCRPDRTIRSSSGEGFGGAGLHFLEGDVLEMAGDRPLVAEWIGNLAVPIAPEHGLARHRGFGTCLHGALEQGIRVLDIQVDRDRTPAEGCGGPRT